MLVAVSYKSITLAFGARDGGAVPSTAVWILSPYSVMIEQEFPKLRVKVKLLLGVP